MDKDLKDAVLAAFDGEPEDKKSKEEGAGVEEEQAEEAADAEDVEAPAATAIKGGAGVKRKPGLGSTGTVRRPPAAGMARKPVPAAAAREPAEEAPAPVAHAAAPRAHAAAHPAPVHAAPASAAGGSARMLLIVNAILAVLVIVLMVQVAGLKSALRKQESALSERITDLKNYARVTVGVYAEPGKRPQRVIAVHDVVDGKIKLGKMTISPLEEE